MWMFLVTPRLGEWHFVLCPKTIGLQVRHVLVIGFVDGMFNQEIIVCEASCICL